MQKMYHSPLTMILLLFYRATTVTPPQDYVPISSPITFTPLNQNQVQCRDITVNDDLICEADETIQVALTTAEDPNEVRLSPASATVTIIDNDGRSVTYHSVVY